jgi:hypothetical protein
MPSATSSSDHRPQHVPPPIPAQRRKTRHATGQAPQPEATIPLNLEDLMIEMESQGEDASPSEREHGNEHEHGHGHGNDRAPARE